MISEPRHLVPEHGCDEIITDKDDDFILGNIMVYSKYPYDNVTAIRVTDLVYNLFEVGDVLDCDCIRDYIAARRLEWNQYDVKPYPRDHQKISDEHRKLLNEEFGRDSTHFCD